MRAHASAGESPKCDADSLCTLTGRAAAGMRKARGRYRASRPQSRHARRVRIALRKPALTAQKPPRPTARALNISKRVVLVLQGHQAAPGRPHLHVIALRKLPQHAHLRTAPVGLAVHLPARSSGFMFPTSTRRATLCFLQSGLDCADDHYYSARAWKGRSYRKPQRKRVA
jgi:hypothetical protein